MVYRSLFNDIIASHFSVKSHCKVQRLDANLLLLLHHINMHASYILLRKL